MNRDNIYTMHEALDIDIEAFDAIEEKHEFSKEYQEQKKHLLETYRREQSMKSWKKYAAVAAAAAVILVATPVAANAATNGELFNRIWGNEGKSSIASHDEERYDEEKGSSYTVTFPQRDYVEADPEKADELVGDKISFEPYEVDLDGTKITILSAVRDSNAAVVEMKIENPNGVAQVLNYSQEDNEAKGAWISEDATFNFMFANSGDSLYVDLDKSTDTVVYCYDYITMDGAFSSLQFQTEVYPCKRSEFTTGDISDEKLEQIYADTVKENHTIALADALDSSTFTSESGGTLEISPISMNLDCTQGLGLTHDEAYDPYNIYYLKITYQDGSEYVVWDHSNENKGHSAEVEIDNSSYACGTLENHLKIVFNRLVDVEQIATITVNETSYVK